MCCPEADRRTQHEQKWDRPDGCDVRQQLSVDQLLTEAADEEERGEESNARDCGRCERTTGSDTKCHRGGQQAHDDDQPGRCEPVMDDTLQSPDARSGTGVVAFPVVCDITDQTRKREGLGLNLFEEKARVVRQSDCEFALCADAGYSTRLVGREIAKRDVLEQPGSIRLEAGGRRAVDRFQSASGRADENFKFGELVFCGVSALGFQNCSPMVVHDVSAVPGQLFSDGYSRILFVLKHDRYEAFPNNGGSGCQKQRGHDDWYDDAPWRNPRGLSSRPFQPAGGQAQGQEGRQIGGNGSHIFQVVRWDANDYPAQPLARLIDGFEADCNFNDRESERSEK